MDTEWSINELRTFVSRCEAHDRLWDLQKVETVGERQSDILAMVPLVHRIADRAWPEWRESERPKVYRSWKHDEALERAREALVLLEREEELREKLGDPGPSLAAGSLHPDVWQAAQRLWPNGHFGDAVRTAARNVNAMLQKKLDRRDVADADLISQAFSLKPPEVAAPRLRVAARAESLAATGCLQRRA